MKMRIQAKSCSVPSPDTHPFTCPPCTVIFPRLTFDVQARIKLSSRPSLIPFFTVPKQRLISRFRRVSCKICQAVCRFSNSFSSDNIQKQSLSYLWLIFFFFINTLVLGRKSDFFFILNFKRILSL